MKPELPTPPETDVRNRYMDDAVFLAGILTIIIVVLVIAITSAFIFDTPTPTPKELNTMSKAKKSKARKTPPSDTPPKETKAEAFKKVGNRRVRKILHALTVLGNTADPARYDHTPEQKERMFKAIDEGVAELKKRFDPAVVEESKEFDLDAEDAEPGDEAPPLHVVDDEPE